MKTGKGLIVLTWVELICNWKGSPEAEAEGDYEHRSYLELLEMSARLLTDV